ncbi:MAG: DUF3458 domain-containing protein, partial [SAR324 cluster bacterium]|nr:DUF3458 domain-containing protein [SAR324 cluster bacterium]
LGLLSTDGNDLPLKLSESTADKLTDTIILELRKKIETFVFEDIPIEPVPSLGRGFSAPVKLHFDYNNADLAFLLANDTDEFNRWEAGQQLMIRISLEQIQRFQNNQPFQLPTELENAFRSLLNQTADSDPALLALALSFPNESYLGEFMDIIDVLAIHKTRKFLRTELAQKLQPEFKNTYLNFQNEGTFKIDHQSMGRRSLKNLCLSYLSELESLEIRKLSLAQFRKNENMTDVAGALGVLTHIDCEERKVVFKEFEKKWGKNKLVMDKWFALQAISSLPQTLDNVKVLTNHQAYEKNNPNKIRALISTFSRFNQLRFHATDGSGYEFLADQVLRLDTLNPQTAARLVSVFNNWKNYAVVHKTKMNDQLQRILKIPNLSGDVFEIVSKALD